MEEIEYLEEYEDFILPNAGNCAGKLSVERTSIDSLEGLYKDLIGDSCSLPERTSTSQYTAKPAADADKTSFSNAVDGGLLAKQIQTSKCNVDSGSLAYLNKTTSTEIHQLYKPQTSNISFINRAANKSFSTTSSLRTDKLKSVATVKPTLQRVSNPVKKSVSYNSPPFKNAKVVHSFRPYSHTSASASTETKNTIAPKASVNTLKNNEAKKIFIKTSELYQGSGVDPLSLEDHDGFLDFDVDKNGFVNDFDFESDLDNSITAGISDMDSDSVDLSDDYSDGNFDLESDLSSEISDVKRNMLFKRKKPQKSSSGENTDKLKTKPGATFKKTDIKRDQTNLSKSKVSQKTIDSDKRPNQASFGERKIYETAKKPQIIGTKEYIGKTLTPKNKELSLKTPVLPKLLDDSNECVEKLPNVVSNAKQAAKRAIVVKKDESATNLNLKASSAINKSEKFCSEKPESNKTHANVEIAKNRDAFLKAKSIESSSEDTIKKISPESKLSKSLSPQHNTEQKEAETPDKNARLKFGSFYLKSIKPPISKGLLGKNTPQKQNTPSIQQQSEQNNRILPTPKPVRKLTEDFAINGNKNSQKSSPENKEIEKSKTSLHDLKSGLSNIVKKDTSQQKSHVAHEHDRSNDKIAATENTNEKSRRHSVKLHNHSADTSEKQLSDSSAEKRSMLSRNEVKESKQVGQRTKSSERKLLENNTNESNSSKESISKAKDNTVHNERISTSLCQFKPRSFYIRLNKNIVAQLTRPSKPSTKSKGLGSLKSSEHVSENTLKRKMTALSNIDASTKNSSPESGQDKISKPQKDVLPETQQVCKKAKISSDIPSTIVEKQTEIQTKDAENTVKRSRRGRKRKFKTNAPPKILRSGLKLLPQINDIPNHNILHAETPVNDSSSTKELNVQKSPKISASITSQNEVSIASNSNSAEIGKKNRRRGRPFKKIRRQSPLADGSENTSQPNNESALSVLTPSKDNSHNDERERTPIPTAAVLIDQCVPTENIGPVSPDRAEKNMNSEAHMIHPKAEIYGDTLIIHYQPELTANGNVNSLNACLSPKRNDVSRSLNTSQNSDCRNETEFTVFELPSYIVMKTKIVTRRDLDTNKAQIPPLVKQKMDKLAEERQVIPVLKSERPDFKYVCSEINALLARNANYLKFASGSERQTRMNQVVTDSSLSVDDAQCALKFLQSYLSLRTKDLTARSKNQQFIPIYDSQKKIIGYRKRTTHSKKSNQSYDSSIRRIAPNNMPPVNTPACSSVPSILNVCTVSAISSVEKAVEFSTKNEPQVVDAGEGEIIVPDAAPSAEHCIKNEDETIIEVT